jgi:hypothetical protein
MQIRLIESKPWLNVYENDVDSFIPEIWANESLLILVENMIAGNLVYRDFENQLQNFGDVVNTRRPAEFTAKRKTNADNVVIQDAIATNIPVPLDQHVHVSFLIRDGEESKSFADLVQQFLKPAITAQARFIDQLVLSQYAQFLGNTVGGPGALTTSNAKGAILALRQLFNIAKAPVDSRNLVLNPLTETTLLNLDIFTQAQQVGDQGEALRKATLGEKLGWNMWLDQNMPVVAAGNTTVAGAINNASGYPKGTVTFTVDGFSAAIPANSWIVVAGDLTPLRVISTVGGATPTSITVDAPGLRADVVNDAVVTRYSPGAVNNSGGYPVGYAKEITVDGFTVAPQVGQLVTFGTVTTSTIYTIINVNALVGITLDKPLKVALANDDAVNLGPAGAFNFAFNREAIALVVRPLAVPRKGTGALSAVVNWNDLSMRVTITYDGNKQGHLVTIDMLCGIAVLDNRLGGVLVG